MGRVVGSKDKGHDLSGRLDLPVVSVELFLCRFFGLLGLSRGVSKSGMQRRCRSASRHAGDQAFYKIDPDLLLLIMLTKQAVDEEAPNQFLDFGKPSLRISGKPGYHMTMTITGSVGEQTDNALDNPGVLS
jgi:hypothetical protein